MTWSDNAAVTTRAPPIESEARLLKQVPTAWGNRRAIRGIDNTRFTSERGPRVYE